MDLTVLSVYLSLFLFFLSILVCIQGYYSQTSFSKRLSWCLRSSKDKSWIVLFNGSKRILLKDDVYGKTPLTINVGDFQNPRIIGWELFDKNPELKKTDDPKQVRIDFEYMEPKAYMVIEFDGKRVSKSPSLNGHLADGDINKKPWWGMSITHNFFFYLFWMLLPWGIYLFFLFRALCKDCFVFDGYLLGFTIVCSIIIFLILYSAHTFRRIPYLSFKKAKKIIRKQNQTTAR